MLKTTMTFDCEVEVYKDYVNYAPELVGRWDSKCTPNCRAALGAEIVCVDTH